MEYVKIINVYAQIIILVKIVLYMNVLIIVQNTAVVIAKLELVHVILASMVLIAQKKNAKINAQRREYAIMILEYVNV